MFNENNSQELECFDGIFDRESKRFLDSMDIASRIIFSALSSEDETKEDLDLESLDDIHNFCRLASKLGINLLELHLPNSFIKSKEDSVRRQYDIYSSGVRRIVTRYGSSQLVKKFIPFFRLGDLFESSKDYKNNLSDLLKYFELFSRDLEKYANNLDKGAEIVESFSYNDDDEKDYSSEMNSRLYASIKTWAEDDDFNLFLDNYKKMMDGGIEIIITSPVKLFLKLGKDGIMIIWKAFISNEDEVKDDKKSEFPDLKEFNSHLYDAISEETKQLGILNETERLFRMTTELYIDSFRNDQESLRSLIKGRAKRKEFLEKFESGDIFSE